MRDESTRMYREQHEHLLAAARELDSLLDAGALRANGKTARAALARLAGRLHVHLAMEDRSLYPALLSRPEASVRDTAARLQAEMGRLRAEVDGYLLRWPSARALEARPEGFVAETRAILAALQARIGLEDRELFPLVDRAG